MRKLKRAKQIHVAVVDPDKQRQIILKTHRWRDWPFLLLKRGAGNGVLFFCEETGQYFFAQPSNWVGLTNLRGRDFEKVSVNQVVNEGWRAD